MDDSYILKQWKAKDQQLFQESKFNSIFFDKGKIFSSTAINDSDESVRLHLTETPVEDTESQSKNSSTKILEPIIISDSDSDDDNQQKFEQRKIDQSSERNITQRKKNVYLSDRDKENKKVYGDLINSKADLSSNSRVLKPNNVPSKSVAISDSETESELEEEKVPEIIKDTIVDCATLSSRKKAEILRWLETNVEVNTRLTSSSNSTSVISDSRKSSNSSGNSSLERLELHFETPNNRGRFLPKPKSSSTSKGKSIFDLDVDQTRIDQYFNVKPSQNQTPINQPIRRAFRIISETPDSDGTLRNSETSSSSEKENLRSNDKDAQQSLPLSKFGTVQKAVDIDDCADILDNLYGNTWRINAKNNLPVTEPKKNPIKKLQTNNLSERKIQPKNILKTTAIIERKIEKGSNVKRNISKIPLSTTKSKIFSNPNSKRENSFIKNSSSSESSPDCTYYTALTNNDKFNKKHSDKATTINKKENNVNNDLIVICDSDTNSDDDDKWNKIQDKRKKLVFSSDSAGSSTSEFDPDDLVPPKSPSKKFAKPQYLTTKQTSKPTTSVTKSFLASLSTTVPLHLADKKALTFRSKYKTMKEELCKYLFNLYNEKVFENKLPTDLQIEWNNRMRNTAGYCYNRKSIKALGAVNRSSRIVLATKILDTADRLRDTLIHELCHAATWLLNNVSDGHGPFWRSWAQKAMQTFPELPTIKRCHDYDVKTKFTYKCATCGYCIGRHSKSIDTEKKRCGYCHGKFELLINRTTRSGTVKTKSAALSKEPSGFALFVKENYQTIKQNSTGAKHADIMKILGQQFSAVKITPKSKV